jgi:cell division protein FtsW
MKTARPDTSLLIILAALVLGGLLMFSSAAVGLLARGNTHISGVMMNHILLGVGLGLIGLLLASVIDYKLWRRYATYLFGAAIFATLLTFTPGLTLEHGGGRLWLDFGFATFQPAELLKITGIMFAAMYFANLREETQTWKGLATFAGICGPLIIILGLQPDFGTLGVILISIFSVAVAAGVRLRDIALIACVGATAVLIMSFIPRYDYFFSRIDTFLNPAAQNAQGGGYQIRQSLIAIGSGGFTGRGIGQGIQKFTYLPEPMGDSIYAVIAEELGFLGGSLVIVLFLILGLKGLSIAAHAPDFFGGLMAVGISAYLVGEAFVNIAAMLGMAPLTGIPLTFISQGGSAMMVSLASAGILINISRHQTKK